MFPGSQNYYYLYASLQYTEAPSLTINDLGSIDSLDVSSYANQRSLLPVMARPGEVGVCVGLPWGITHQLLE